MWRNLAFKTPSAATEPLTASAFATLMQPFVPVSLRLAVAVSGGPDSMALAWYVHNWTAVHQGDLRAFIVDHGLRPDSASEATATQQQLARIGLKAEILRWEHPPIASRIHLLARKARYRLLIEACQRHAITDLLLAHHQDDQAETILMRLAKGSGVDGLAGMATQNTVHGLRLLRPLLHVPKDRLIAACQAAQMRYISDPSNGSSQFARGRLRRVMPLLATEGLTIDRMIDLAARAADVKAALDYYTLDFLRISSHRDDAGTLRIDLDKLRTAQTTIAQRAVQTCLQTFNAQRYPPEHASLLLLVEALLALKPMTPRTLHGCLVSRTTTQAVFMREEAAIADHATLHDGERVQWDNRWHVLLMASDPSLSYTIRPLGNQPHDVVDSLAPGLRRKIPQGRARATLPALWQGAKLVKIPTLGDKSPCCIQLMGRWPPQPLSTPPGAA
jgi:tRNA(Ile)-lysidine synthase